MSSKKIRHQAKPDTRYNPDDTARYVDRQRKMEETGYVMVRENKNTIRIILNR